MMIVGPMTICWIVLYFPVDLTDHLPRHACLLFAMYAPLFEKKEPKSNTKHLDTRLLDGLWVSSCATQHSSWEKLQRWREPLFVHLWLEVIKLWENFLTQDLFKQFSELVMPKLVCYYRELQPSELQNESQPRYSVCPLGLYRLEPTIQFHIFQVWEMQLVDLQ